jgi:hypothetical protein
MNRAMKKRFSTEDNKEWKRREREGLSGFSFRE